MIYDKLSPIMGSDIGPISLRKTPISELTIEPTRALVTRRSDFAGWVVGRFDVGVDLPLCFIRDGWPAKVKGARSVCIT